MGGESRGRRLGAEDGARTRRAGAGEAARVATLVEGFGRDPEGFQYRWVEFLMQHLVHVSRFFEGDLQQMMVLALIGQMRLRALRTARAEGEEGARAPAERTGITAMRLSDASGIPRETVRRKLRVLEARGWIARDAEGFWHIAVDEPTGETPARRDLAEVHDQTPERVARLVVELERLVEP